MPVTCHDNLKPIEAYHKGSGSPFKSRLSIKVEWNSGNSQTLGHEGHRRCKWNPYHQSLASCGWWCMCLRSCSCMVHPNDLMILHYGQKRWSTCPPAALPPSILWHSAFACAALDSVKQGVKRQVAPCYFSIGGKRSPPKSISPPWSIGQCIEPMVGTSETMSSQIYRILSPCWERTFDENKFSHPAGPVTRMSKLVPSALWVQVLLAAMKTPLCRAGLAACTVLLSRPWPSQLLSLLSLSN